MRFNPQNLEKLHVYFILSFHFAFRLAYSKFHKTTDCLQIII